MCFSTSCLCAPHIHSSNELYVHTPRRSGLSNEHIIKSFASIRRRKRKSFVKYLKLLYKGIKLLLEKRNLNWHSVSSKHTSLDNGVYVRFHWPTKVTKTSRVTYKYIIIASYFIKHRMKRHWLSIVNTKHKHFHQQSIRIS